MQRTDQHTRLIGATIALVLIFAIALSVLMLTTRSAPAQNASFYGKDGSYQGQSFTYGNQKSFTNERGEFSGSSIKHGNTTNFYDKGGRFQGSTVQQGTNSFPLSGGRR